MLSSILAAIVAIFSAIPYFNKWFVKTPEQISEENQAKINQEEDTFKKTGRPSE